MPGIKTLECDIEILKRRDTKGYRRRERNQNNLGVMGCSEPDLIDGFPDEQYGGRHEHRGRQVKDVVGLQKIGKEDLIRADIEVFVYKLVGGNRIERGEEKSIVDHPGRPRERSSGLFVVTFHDKRRLVEDVDGGA